MPDKKNLMLNKIFYVKPKATASRFLVDLHASGERENFSKNKPAYFSPEDQPGNIFGGKNPDNFEKIFSPRIELIPRKKERVGLYKIFQMRRRNRLDPVFEEKEFFLIDQPAQAEIDDSILIPSLGFGWKSLKSAAIFSLVMLIFVLPFKSFDAYEFIINQKGRVLGVSEEAISSLFAATTQASNLEFAEAQNNFIAAQKNFQAIGDDVGSWKILLNLLGKIIPGQKIQMGAAVDNVLAAGELGAKIGGNLSQIMIYAGSREMTNQGKIVMIEKEVKSIKENTGLLNRQLSEIDPLGLPDEYRPVFLSLLEKSWYIEKTFAEIESLISAIKIFSGFEYDKRYLLVFQNNSELRATGGFIGSYAILDLSKGEMKNIEIPAGGSYDTAGGMLKRIASPEALHLVSPRWFFWDANWWPDWPTSSAKLKWFLEESQGPSVDGVISFTPAVMEKILGLIDGVYLEKYDLAVNQENFWAVAQAFSEQKPKDHPDYQPNPFISSTTEASLDPRESKQIIGDLFEAMMAKLKTDVSKEMIFGLIEIFADSLDGKLMLFNFNDSRLQAEAERFGGDGRMTKTKHDYIQVVHSNIAGGKSDREIDNRYKLNTEFQADGSIINTLVIERAHSGVKRTRFTGVRNVDWLRVYVPLGCELLSADGFSQPDQGYFDEPDAADEKDPLVAAAEATEITHQPSGTKVYEDLGKTVFANWTMVDPGETSRIELKYRLPGKINLFPSNQEKAHLLVWQKQAGDMASDISLDFSWPLSWNLKESGGDLSCLDLGCRQDKDKYWFFVFE